MDERKEYISEQRGRSKSRRAKKKKTFEDYGWMRRISPTRKNTGNSTSKNDYYGAPGRLRSRLEKTEENRYTIHYVSDLIDEADGFIHLPEVQSPFEFVEEPPKILLDH